MGGWVSLRENSLALSADTFRLSWGCEVGGDTQRTPVTRDVEAVAPPPFLNFLFLYQLVTWNGQSAYSWLKKEILISDLPNDTC